MRSLLRRIPLLLLALVLGAPTAAAKDEPTKPFFLAPTEWLVLGHVDGRARRPFNPDTVFARHVHDRASGVPQEGDTITGGLRKQQTWKKARVDKQGRVGGGIAWAYTRIESDRDRVVIARLLGAARLFVNGTASVGAIYGSGFQTFPVALKKGGNDVFVRGVRGAFKLTFERPPGPIFVAPQPLHLPDLVAGESIDAVAGVWIVNAQTVPLERLRISLPGNEHLVSAEVDVAGPIAPLGTLQVRLPIRTKPGRKIPTELKHVDVVFQLEGAPIARLVRLAVRAPTDSILRTFISSIDDSVQVYGLRRPSPPKAAAPEARPARPKGLVLSLHGAGVGPRSQADAYSSKPDFWHVFPTNRAAFGFDWQDWGRTDAYEVLADALALSGVDRSRVYLTGHSMGGHGTWHLAANDPDGFAAIAPSAGWISFDTYGGRRPKSPLSDLWHDADAASRTRTLLDNLVQLPTYIVHGTKDDNVPVAQAKEMESLLADLGAKPRAHYAADAGHWWNGDAAEGADCVDWPGIFDLFRAHEIEEAPLDLRFTTVDPAVDAVHHWVQVHRPVTYGRPSHVEAKTLTDVKTIEVTTRNVGVLSLRHPRGYTSLVVDGRKLTIDADKRVFLVTKQPDALVSWVPFAQLPAEGLTKSPTFCGPFKRAFGGGFVLVHGTTGTKEENRESLERARHDAAAWVYRANGQSRVLSDEAFLALRGAGELDDRNAILYGNRDTNSALRLVAVRWPRVSRGAIAFDDRTWIGSDLSAAFLSPANDGRGGLLGVFADTGVDGARLGYTLLPFVSGAGYPDYCVFDPRILTKGDGGVLAAGWFDSHWQLQKGGFKAPK